jgi:CelD/BcsL family acetyltransferase involved in cellulose biosynthesis
MLDRLNASDLIRSETFGREQMYAIDAAWQQLADNSIEDNVYYRPAYARALLDTVEANTDVRFATVWRGAQLIGLLPFVASRLPSLIEPWTAWKSDYTYNCTPLLHRDWHNDAAEHLVRLMAAANPGEWTLPLMNTAGPACRAIVAALEADCRPWIASNLFARAVLDTGCTFAEHMERHVSAKRRRDLGRNERRLEKLGTVSFESCSGGPELKSAVDAFLQIEARGWKGRRGTALQCNEATRAFASKVFSSPRSSNACRADLLKLNGEPIAVGLTLVSGRTGFTVKCAYDERYANYSAGLLLEVAFLRGVLGEKWASRIDSGTAGSHVIDELWPGRSEVGDLLFSVAHSPGSGRFPAFVAGQRAKRATIETAKSIVNRFRARVTA